MSSSSETAALWKFDSEHIWHPFTNMEKYKTLEPVIIEKGEGNWLIDTEGNKYLDGISSLWSNVHGHNVKEINDAIKQQVDNISHSTLFGNSHLISIKLTKLLLSILPDNLNRIHYSESGSSAVEAAIKIAYLYWLQKSPETVKKRRFLSLSQGYHGETLAGKSVGTPHNLNKRIYGDMLFPVKFMPSPYCGDCELKLKKETCGERCLQVLKENLEKHENEIAGVILEPLVQGAGGIRIAYNNYLKQVRELCTRHNVLLIIDEVATGFGKTGKMFAVEHENVKPDIMCIAKGLTGGYLPLAATAVSDKVYDSFRHSYTGINLLPHGHTYSGNQLACAAAIASIELFSKNNVLEELQDKIAYLTSKLEKVKKLSSVSSVRQKGVMTGVAIFVPGKADVEVAELVKSVCIYAQSRGVIIRPLAEVIIVMPPLSITNDEIDLLTDVLIESIKVIIK